MEFLKVHIQTIILSPITALYDLGNICQKSFKDWPKIGPFYLVKQVHFGSHLEKWLDEGSKYELYGQIVDML